MADVIDFQARRQDADKTNAQTCALLYQRLNIDPSNVVFAPGFYSHAQRLYADCAPVVKEAS